MGWGQGGGYGGRYTAGKRRVQLLLATPWCVQDSEGNQCEVKQEHLSG